MIAVNQEGEGEMMVEITAEETEVEIEMIEEVVEMTGKPLRFKFLTIFKYRRGGSI